MGSISYERYRKIAESLNKKVVVITDNDGKNKQYDNTDLFSIFSDENIENWTLEVAFYNSNKSTFDKEYKAIMLRVILSFLYRKIYFII